MTKESVDNSLFSCIILGQKISYKNTLKKRVRKKSNSLIKFVFISQDILSQTAYFDNSQHDN